MLFGSRKARYPMADHAPTYTPRFRIKYSTCGATHHMTWRLPRSESDPSSYAGKAKTFLDALASLRYVDWTFLGAEFAEVDSGVFLPTAMTAPVAGTQSVPGVVGQARPNAVSFVGRTTLGKRAVFYLYGLIVKPREDSAVYNDWRVTTLELAALSTAIGVLTETPPQLCGNDGATVNWYPYVNVKANDYWVRRARQG